jgi:uncharacterized repeat protein (TIGR01451 family)
MKDVILTSLAENEQSLLTLNSAKGLAQTKLQGFAQSQDFGKDIALAIGQGRNTDKFRSIWLTGKISFPAIEIRAKSELGGAYGAFSQDTGKVYLSQELINSNSTDLVSSVLLEEYGHYVDTQLNTTDSLGDEGAIFSAVVLGKTLEPEQLQQLKAKDDRTTINLDGQVIQIEKASVSDSGGQQSTPSIYPLKLEADLNILTFSWQNYTIPDEFAVFYDGNRLTKPDQRIIGNVGLEPGGESNKQTVVAKNGSDQVEVKITSPNAGTAWDFSVSSKPLEITVNGLLGDVIKVDISKELQRLNVTLKDLGLDPNGFGLKGTDSKDDTVTRGSVATNVDDYNSDLQKGIFYFVPKVKGDPLEFGATRNDVGIGQSTLTLTNGNIEIPIKFNITDGFSTSGDNKVIFGSDKLPFYRQEQRLAYLGFPGSGGSPLVVDGQPEGNTTWAKQLFNIAVRPEIASARGRIASQDDKSFKNFINSTNAPRWNLLRGAISNFDFPPASNRSQRFYGTDNTGNFIKSGVSTLGRVLKSTGVSQKSGIGAPSSTHDGGRSIDIDDIKIGNKDVAYFFKSIGVGGDSYVAALGGGFVVKDGDTYRAGNPNVKADVLKGVRTTAIASRNLDGSVIKPIVSAIYNANLFDFSQTRAEVQALLDAFPGTPRIFYNDPRFFDTGVIRYQQVHFDHIHFEIPIPRNSASTNRSLLLNSVPVSTNSLAFSSPLFAIANPVEVNAFPGIIDFGNLEDSKNLTGTINTTNTEQYYSFTIGSLQSEEGFFTTPRDFNLLLNGLSGDVDVELFQDFSEDGIRQDGEVIASSTKSGNESEIINLTNLDEGVYYLRVFQKGGDTNYNLSLSIPPLPVPTDNAANTVNTANDLGIIGTNVQLSDFIGEVDADDYYRFTVSSTSDMIIDVTGLTNGDLFAELGQDKNNDGILDFDEVIASSDEEGDTSEKISVTGLAAGEYMLHLGRYSGNTNYDLKLSAPPANIPTDNAGNSSSTAFDIGSLNTVANLSDFVGNVDPEDFYKFALDNAMGLQIELNGLSADADLELAQDTNNDGVIDSNEIISTSELQGTSDEAINLSALAAGTYFVRVHQYVDDTNYNLSLTPTAPAGSDLSITRTEVSGSVDLGQQYTYSLTVKNNGPDTANNVILTESLPSNARYISATASNSSFVNQQSGIATANLGTLENGESATVIFALKPFAVGSLFGTTSVKSDALDYNSANNSLDIVKAVNSIVSPNADLSLTQDVDKLNPNVGDKVTFTLRLTNKGPGTATSIQVLDLLPTTLDFVSATPTIGSYVRKTGIWTVGNIAPNNPVQLVIVATVNSAIPVTNTAEVIAVAENDPDSTPNNNNPNEDDQASITLNTALSIPSLTKIAEDIFTISGGATGKPKLQISISDSNPKSVNDLAVFTVDDAQGRINGIAPTESGYTQAALSRAKDIFSAIANLPNGFDPKTLSRSLEFSSGDNLRFLLVKNDTLDNVRKKDVSNPDILFSNASNQKITDSGTGNFTLAWEDGNGNSTDFKDFVVSIQPTDIPLPLGANLQDQQEGEVLDLRSIDSSKTVQANFVVNREAAYNNFVGFYKIDDSQGTITDPLTGISIKPGDIGYTEAAIKNRVAGIDLQAANQSTATINGAFQGGSIFAPFILVNGSPDQLLDTNQSNDPAVYFAYLGANSDGIDHIRLLGNNTFGFEDLPGGGDLDYNDVIIKANLSVI